MNANKENAKTLQSKGLGGPSLHNVNLKQVPVLFDPLCLLLFLSGLGLGIAKKKLEKKIRKRRRLDRLKFRKKKTPTHLIKQNQVVHFLLSPQPCPFALWPLAGRHRQSVWPLGPAAERAPLYFCVAQRREFLGFFLTGCRCFLGVSPWVSSALFFGFSLVFLWCSLFCFLAHLSHLFFPQKEFP